MDELKAATPTTVDGGMANRPKGAQRKISGLRRAVGASNAWKWKLAQPEIVVVLVCGQAHRWLHAASEDLAFAECPHCSAPIARIVEGPRPRAREEGAGMTERLARVQELYRADLTSEEIDELAELLGRTREDTVALVADFAPGAKLA